MCPTGCCPGWGSRRLSIYQGFADRYKKMNEKLGKKQYLVPYLMSSHPGSTLKDAIALAEAVRDMGYMPEQVQDFYPTPSTISTCMYYTGLDPRTMEDVAIIRKPAPEGHAARADPVPGPGEL